MKYTKEQLEKYVKESIYLSDMIRKMGMTPNSGNNRYLATRIKFYQIDTSHWLSASEKSKRFNNAGIRKKTKEEILSYQEGKSKTIVSMIRRALIESNIEYRCSECGIGPEWNNKKLVIQVDHINGNNLDNRIENLRFLCPNCHSQTDNFMSKNIKEKQAKICLDCGEKISSWGKKCIKCGNVSKKQINTKRNNKKPNKEVLQKLIWEKPATHIASEYGVSDKTVEKWCKTYNIEKPPRGYWQKLKSSRSPTG